MLESSRFFQSPSLLRATYRPTALLIATASAFVLLYCVFGLLSSAAVKAQSQPFATLTAVRFVSNTGIDTGNDCTESSNPCQSVQHAVAIATESDEIRVAAGTYSGTVHNFIPAVGDVFASVIITKNIAALLGGYAADFSSRDPNVHITILDGSDLANDWVIFTTGTATRIDGFTLQGIVGKPSALGGAIRIEGGAPTFSHNRISSNHSQQRGGGIYIAGGKPVIASNQIVANTALEGGGIYILTGTVTITGNQIVANVAQAGDGGGILVANGKVAIDNNTIAQNLAISLPVGRGGGILVRGGELLGIRNNRIFANQSADGGSAIESNVGTEIYGNIIHENQVLLAGSALLIERTSVPITLTNNLLYKNLGTGITLRDFTTAMIVNNTSHQNRYVSFGAPGNGIDVNASITPTVPFTATILNNIVSDNEQCGIEAYNGIVIEIDYNDIFNNQTDFCNTALPPNGTHNLNVDPHYIDPATGNYRPTPGGAVVDTDPNNAPTLDLLGDPRPYASGIDMGAIEAGPVYMFLPVVQK